MPEEAVTLVDTLNSLGVLLKDMGKNEEAEKLLRENAEKLPDELKATTEEPLAAAKAAVESEDLEQIEAAHDGLEKVMHEVASKIYSQEDAAGGDPMANGAGSDEATAEDEGAGDDIIDVPFEESPEA